MRLSEQGVPVQVEDNIVADKFIAAASEQRIRLPAAWGRL